MTSHQRLKDWVPVRLYDKGPEKFVDWCYLGDQRFTHPFFADTIKQRMREPFNIVFRHQTPVEVLGDLCMNRNAIPPTGFIFHMSRCGSTLVAQMLAALPSNIVISEAPPIDAAISDATCEGELLRAMITVLGRRRTSDERHYFIKFDSWNTLDLNRITAAYPDVPWIFMYRDPIEVMVSQMKQRGSQMVPGGVDRVLPDISIDEAIRMPAEEYCARVLARICSVALRHATEKRALLINYHQLPDVVTDTVAEHFRLSLTGAEVKQMEQGAQFNAKTPRMFFEPDTAQKQAGATDAIRRAADKWLKPLYEQLENIRLKNHDRDT